MCISAHSAGVHKVRKLISHFYTISQLHPVHTDPRQAQATSIGTLLSIGMHRWLSRGVIMWLNETKWEHNGTINKTNKVSSRVHQMHYYSYEQSWTAYKMSIYVRALSFAFFTFPICLEQLPLPFKQPFSLSIYSNSCFSQKRLQQVLYITAKVHRHHFPDY